MGYVKGCDLSIVSKSIIKKIEEGKMIIAEELKAEMPVDKLKAMFEEASKNFVDITGSEKKGVPSGHVYIMTKKIEKQRVILGAASIKSRKICSSVLLEAYFAASSMYDVKRFR